MFGCVAVKLAENLKPDSFYFYVEYKNHTRHTRGTRDLDTLIYKEFRVKAKTSFRLGTMTTIIGVQKKDGCLLAADSRTVGEDGRPFSHPDVVKISQRGPFLIAGAGDAQACDIIQHIWKPPRVPVADINLYKFMVTKVGPSIRACLKKNEYILDKKDTESGYVFLLAIRGVIYELDDSCTVYLRDDGFYGIGSGSSYAVGALQAGVGWEKAMKIAEKNDIYTAAPFIYYNQEI